MSGMGFNGKLYIGVEARQVRDVSTDMSGTEVDDTTRDNEGWESNAVGLKKWSVNFQMVRATGDTVYSTLKTAFKSGAAIANVRVLDALGDEVSGSCKVAKMSKAEPLNGVVMMDVTLTGQGKPTWD